MFVFAIFFVQVQPHTQQQVIWTTNTGPQETHTIAVQQQKTYYA